MLHTLRTARTSRTPLRHAATSLPAQHVRPAPAAAPDDAFQHALGIDQLFVHARDALVMIDVASDRILRWNTAAEDLFGYAADEAIDQNVQMLMPPALARLHQERMAHYRRTGDTDVLLDRPLGVPARHCSGAELRVELSVTPIELPGTPRRWALLTFRDARCQQAAELASLANARVEAAHDEVESKLRESRELLDATTREIAEPLERLRRAAERLGRLSRDGSAAERGRLNLLTRVVEARTREMQRTLENLSVAATIQRGEFELQAERVNLVPLVARLVAQVRTASPLHRINVSAPQGLTAVCDAARVETLLADLLQRAIRRNPRGCWIDVDLRRPLVGVAQIEIRDYGRRLSERERASFAFGAGVVDRGWFINRYVVERHGGTLKVEFPREGGMRVALSLPTHGRKLSARAR